MRRVGFAWCVMVCVGGCAAPARLPVEAGAGLKPELPAPERALIPIIHVAKATGWSTGTKPTVAAGLYVSQLAAHLEHPRWLYVLPNGDVLVAETNGPARPDDSKGLRAKIQSYFSKKA